MIFSRLIIVSNI
uniref:Uncharacterized protein n=1 Tax=Lepeophtheirus salmonis TaxID=72036 RepID=A0A0K2T4Z8_LEPSM